MRKRLGLSIWVSNAYLRRRPSHATCHESAKTFLQIHDAIGKSVYGLGKHIQQRLAVIVPDGPTDCNEVLKLRPAEPIRTSRENTCGIQAYLFRCELGCNAPHQWRWGRPFEGVEDGDAEGCNQTDTQSTNSTTNSNSQAATINSRKH